MLGWQTFTAISDLPENFAWTLCKIVSDIRLTVLNCLGFRCFFNDIFVFKFFYFIYVGRNHAKVHMWRPKENVFCGVSCHLPSLREFQDQIQVVRFASVKQWASLSTEQSHWPSMVFSSQFQFLYQMYKSNHSSRSFSPFPLSFSLPALRVRGSRKDFF